MFLNCSTCFEQHTAHHQGLRGCNYSFWAPDDERCRLKHVEQLRNIGIINSTTWSHLVGYFYTIYTMMHGCMNIIEFVFTHDHYYLFLNNGAYLSTKALEALNNTVSPKNLQRLQIFILLNTAQTSSYLIFVHIHHTCAFNQSAD